MEWKGVSRILLSKNTPCYFNLSLGRGTVSFEQFPRSWQTALSGPVNSADSYFRHAETRGAVDPGSVFIGRWATQCSPSVSHPTVAGYLQLKFISKKKRTKSFFMCQVKCRSAGCQWGACPRASRLTSERACAPPSSGTGLPTNRHQLHQVCVLTRRSPTSGFHLNIPSF